LITRMRSGKEYRAYSTLLSSPLHSPVSSSHSAQHLVANNFSSRRTYRQELQNDVSKKDVNKSQWLLYVPPDLTSKNSTFRIYSVCLLRGMK
jgi:hypothetical protein